MPKTMISNLIHVDFVTREVANRYTFACVQCDTTFTRTFAKREYLEDAMSAYTEANGVCKTCRNEFVPAQIVVETVCNWCEQYCGNTCVQ
jgi:hypothetical protein